MMGHIQQADHSWDPWENGPSSWGFAISPLSGKQPLMKISKVFLDITWKSIIWICSEARNVHSARFEMPNLTQELRKGEGRRRNPRAEKLKRNCRQNISLIFLFTRCIQIFNISSGWHVVSQQTTLLFPGKLSNNMDTFAHLNPNCLQQFCVLAVTSYLDGALETEKLTC